MTRDSFLGNSIFGLKTVMQDNIKFLNFHVFQVDCGYGQLWVWLIVGMVNCGYGQLWVWLIVGMVNCGYGRLWVWSIVGIKLNTL